jgi:hypothetical protein
VPEGPFSPLDEELQLVPGHLTPSLQEASVRLSTWMPFARAAKEFQWFTRVTVTEPLTRRLAEAAGAAYLVALSSCPGNCIHLQNNDAHPDETDSLRLPSPCAKISRKERNPKGIFHELHELHE